ncbi:MAG: DUF2341 domain-containing protein, partial [Verrucomicrobiota bacterium]
PTPMRQWILDFGNNATGQGVHLLIRSDFDAQFGLWASSQNIFSLSPQVGVWSHVTMVHRADDSVATYLNGAVVDADPAVVPNLQPSAGLRIGRKSSGTQSDYNGLLDEVRISRVDRSASWIYATWLNMASNDLFVCNEPVQRGIPLITNDDAANVMPTSADLAGNLISTGSAATEVSVYLGPADGGTDKAAWARVESFGVQAPGSLMQNLGGLTPDTLYYFRYYASNSFGEVFAEESGVFYTGAFSIQATVPTVLEGDDEPERAGILSIFRPAAAVGAAMDVNVTISGSAENGVDYPWLPTTATFPAGASRVDLAVIPIDDVRIEGDETVTVELVPGAYRIGSPSNATVTIRENDVPSDWAHHVRWRFCGYDRNETLTHWPALIRLGPHLPAFDYDQCASASGADLRFYDAAQTRLLHHEIESWDTNGSSWVWVQVPELIDNTTTIYAMWGNFRESVFLPNAIKDATWSEGFEAVWHLQDPDAFRPCRVLDGIRQEYTLSKVAPHGIDRRGVV